MSAGHVVRPPDGDWRAWQAYHEAEARDLAEQPPAATERDRIGQLLGEMDHWAEAIGYAELFQREYSRQMAAARERGLGEMRASLDARHTGWENLGELQNAARAKHVLARQMGEQASEQALRAGSVLSLDDWQSAYERGAKQAVTQWLLDQKELHGLGRQSQQQEGHMPEQARETESASRELAKAIIDEDLAVRPLEIEREWRSATAETLVQAGAATNYFRGRADEWNATRESIARNHPELAKDLPPAIQVDEIVVRQQALEREQERDRSLEVAR